MLTELLQWRQKSVVISQSLLPQWQHTVICLLKVMTFFGMNGKAL